jgi:hypothetical protein
MRRMVSACRLRSRLAGIAIAVVLAALAARPATAQVAPADADSSPPADAAAPVDAGVPLPEDLTLAPELLPSAPLTLDAPAPVAALPPRPPFYHRNWFWGAVGVVVLTTAIVLIATSTARDEPPSTTLGNMRAF